MAKMTKKQTKLHDQAETLLKKDYLSFEDKEFILENWNEAARHDISASGAFFTPNELAADFAIEVPVSHHKSLDLIDLCAGIGTLAFWAYHRADPEHRPNIVCVERNPYYVAIGRKILPEATWICEDVFEYLKNSQQRFDVAFGNSPFGSQKTPNYEGAYAGSRFEYKVIEKATEIAEYGVFIVPQGSSPFQYSGRPYYDRKEPRAYTQFKEQTGIHLEAGCGIDTSIYAEDWKNTQITTEIVTVESISIPVSLEKHGYVESSQRSIQQPEQPTLQMALF